MPKMVLYGGEKDGLGINGELIVSADSRPDVFHAVPNLDEDRIKKAKGDTAKTELRNRLAVLAYRYDPERSTANHFKFYRAPELDKVLH